MLFFFLKGFVIGLAIAIPVGPIGVLCIQRSLRIGFKIGFATGLGAAAADGFYGAVAGFGLTLISSTLMAQQFWIRLIGGLFLVYLGIRMLMKAPSTESSAASSRTEKSTIHAFITTFFLTLTNPMTIFSFVGIFAGLGLGNGSDGYMQALALVAGVTLGSACWWLFLSGALAFVLRHRISPSMMKGLNVASGAIMLGFGFFALKM